MDSIVNRKRVFIAGQPYLKTSSGTNLNIMLAEPKIDKLVLHFELRQLGTGAPSLNNLRPVHNWYHPAFTIDNYIYTIPQEISCPKGTYDSKTGIYRREYGNQAVTSATSYTNLGSSSTFWAYFYALQLYTTEPIICNMFTHNLTTSSAALNDWEFLAISSYPNSGMFKIPNSVLSETSLDGVKQFLSNHPIILSAPLSAGAQEFDIGTMDFKNGTAPTEYTSQTLATSGATSYTTSGNSSIFWGYFNNLNIYNATYLPLYCNMFDFKEYSYDYSGTFDWEFGGSSAYPQSAWFKVPTSILPAASIEGVKQWMENNPITITAPKRYNANASSILSIDPIQRGIRNINFADSNSNAYAEVSYWTH